MKLLWGYANRPGSAARAPETWPAGSALERAVDRPTLVLLAHPHCPCTRASVAELARLMARTEGRLRAYVLFLAPAGTDAGWVKTDLWRSAAAIPGVEVREDPGGREAALFGAATSGQTLLYDERGTLRFAGGLTAARGHQGDTLGKAAILAVVNDGRKETRATTDVFGCALQEEGERTR